jgi:hypothetical protein
MSATLLPNAQQQFFDDAGEPLAGGFVYHYIPSTTTPKTTWVDAAATTANTNPVILDSAGRATIFGNGQYRQILVDALGNTIWDQETGIPGVTPTITGSRGGNAALASLLTALADLGIIVDGTGA